MNTASLPMPRTDRYAATTSSTANVGITSTMLVSMLRISSTMPPRYPAMNPMNMPTIAASPPPNRPTKKLARKPETNCE